jgi:hypothetical protein
MLEAFLYSERSVLTWQTARRHIPEDSSLQPQTLEPQTPYVMTKMLFLAFLLLV